MKRYLTIKRINQIAFKLLVRIGETSPPIKLAPILEELNIKVEKGVLGDSISGLLIQKNGKAAIAVNKHHNETRQRFTIAHELGHFILKHERNGFFIDKEHSDFSLFFRNDESSAGTKQQEIEANAFAAALLMPEPLIEQEIQKMRDKGLFFELGGDNKIIDDLANTFKVSPMAMTYRLSNLNIFRIS